MSPEDRERLKQILECIERCRAEYKEVNEYGKLNMVAWLGETLALGRRGQFNIDALKRILAEGEVREGA